jgi:hypothetical protein
MDEQCRRAEREPGDRAGGGIQPAVRGRSQELEHRPVPDLSEDTLLQITDPGQRHRRGHRMRMGRPQRQMPAGGVADHNHRPSAGRVYGGAERLAHRQRRARPASAGHPDARVLDVPDPGVRLRHRTRLRQGGHRVRGVPGPPEAAVDKHRHHRSIGVAKPLRAPQRLGHQRFSGPVPVTSPSTPAGASRRRRARLRGSPRTRSRRDGAPAAPSPPQGPVSPPRRGPRG